jgi:formylglycine-generating enzyme required for sulfatase activity
MVSGLAWLAALGVSTAPAASAEMVFLPAAQVETGCRPLIAGKPAWKYPRRGVHKERSRDFFLDRTEVTVAAYRACVQAGACTPLARAEQSNYSLAGREQHPVDGISWKQADAYCRFVGKRLPTELEWDRAAQGPSPNQDRYVWGNDPPDCEHVAGTRAEPEKVQEPNERLCVTDLERPRTLPVCSRPRGNSKEGICDLVGNVAEWVSDWFESAFRPPPPPPACAKQTEESDACPTARRHIIKGGTGGYPWVELRQRRTCQGPAIPPLTDVGVRCARDAATPTKK